MSQLDDGRMRTRAINWKQKYDNLKGNYHTIKNERQTKSHANKELKEYRTPKENSVEQDKISSKKTSHKNQELSENSISEEIDKEQHNYFKK